MALKSGQSFYEVAFIYVQEDFDCIMIKKGIQATMSL